MAIARDAGLAERLAAIVGADHAEAQPDIEAGGVRPALAVTPAAPEEAAAVLAAAREAGAVVIPWGGGTQQRIGAPPKRADVVLRTGRLDTVLEWEPADLTASVQAGITLGALQARLAEHGQQLALDAPCAERATLGGLVATNSCGPRRWHYGGWRDQIIGMHMALADGSLIKSGGRVVKNVQGYDLGKLFTGSLGSLGLITQVNLKLAPLPQVRRLLVARGELERVSAFLADVAAAQLRAAAVDLLDEPAAAATGVAGAGCAGFVLLEGTQSLVDAQSAAVQRLATATALSCEGIDGAAGADVVRAWIDLGRSDDLGEHEALLAISALPADVVEVEQALTRAADAFGVGKRSWARFGNGIVYARLSARSGADALAQLARVHEALLVHWPATTLAAGDPALARSTQPWGLPPPGIEVMRALKQRFDPAGTLQRGRYVGGI